MVDVAVDEECEFDDNFEDSGGLLSCLVAACVAGRGKEEVEFVGYLDSPVKILLVRFRFL